MYADRSKRALSRRSIGQETEGGNSDVVIFEEISVDFLESNRRSIAESFENKE